MATLTLDKLWINVFPNGESVAAHSVSRTAQYTNLGDVKHLAGGRQRAVTIVGEQGTYAFTMLDVVAADVDKLRTWKGQTVQVRDDRGQVFVGVFFQVSPAEVPDRKGSYNVSASLRVVTAPEGV